MMVSGIEWTDATWNPVVGCTPVSPGCLNCYAATMARRLEGMAKPGYVGLTVKRDGRSVYNGTVRTLPDRLAEPLRWRSPRMVFVCSMSDLFHESVPFEFIDRVFAVMALCPQHTFQVLTKRPERLAEYLCGDARRPTCCVYDVASRMIDGDFSKMPYNMANQRSSGASWWPLPNVWIGTSAEDQSRLDERVPHLLRCPAAVRFLSCEPLLGPLDLTEAVPHYRCDGGALDAVYHGERVRGDDCGWRGLRHPDEARKAARTLPKDAATTTPGGEGMGRCTCLRAGVDYIFGGVDWVIVGGESGPKARPCGVAWDRSIVEQCREAGVACFMKQLGARPVHPDGDYNEFGFAAGTAFASDGIGGVAVRLKDRKGGDPSEWPEDLRVREMPEASA